MAITAVVLAGCASTLDAPPEAANRKLILGVFEPPSDDRPGAEIDYGAYRGLLDGVVYDVGRSDRKPAPKLQASTGSNIPRGNPSRYRYEANRIAFSQQPKKFEIITTEIVASFKAVAESETIDRMTPNEQLAFWINFHNALLLDQMGKQYPFRKVSQLKAVGTRQSVFKAKIITLRGVDLSLDDIREKIVYETWPEPLVMYGFYKGAIGGPNITVKPFRGREVYDQLRKNAREFVNSLRGVENDDRLNRISKLYADARAPLFGNSWAAVIEHLLLYANKDTEDYLSMGRRVRADVWDDAVADLSYGEASGPIGNIFSIGRDGITRVQGAPGLSQIARRFIDRIERRKYEFFLRSGGGSVTIRDIEDGGANSPAASEPDAPLRNAAPSSDESGDEDEDTNEQRPEGA